MSTRAFVPVTVANGSVTGLDFRILGPLEFTDGDAIVALGGVRQRTLLAILLLNANEEMSACARDRQSVWLGPDLVERVQLILVELELDCFEVLLEVRNRTGPRDRQDHRRVVQQPRQRDLTG